MIKKEIKKEKNVYILLLKIAEGNISLRDNIFYRYAVCKLHFTCIFLYMTEHFQPHQWLSGFALKLVNGRCQVQTPVTLVNLIVWSFPWFSPKIA